MNGLGRYFLNQADKLTDEYHANRMIGRETPEILKDIQFHIQAAQGRGMETRTQRKYLEGLRLGKYA